MSTPNTKNDIKLALVCSGLGNQKRGFESFFENLYNNLKGKIDVTLLKGGGISEGSQIRLSNIKRDSLLLGGKNSKIIWGKRYKLEQMTFSVPMFFNILLNSYNIIQVSDPDLARYLDYSKKIFPRKYRTIFTNAFPTSPNFYRTRFDLVQEVSKAYWDDAINNGVEERHLKLLPYAVDADRFKPANKDEKIALREKFGIPKESFVILSAGSIDSGFKRMDYLIREVSTLPDKVFLLIVGQESQETPLVKSTGIEYLKTRIKFGAYRNEEMPEIYKMADVFALCSLKEGFGLVFIEAMASGLPVVAHHHPNMQWILSDCGKTLDFAAKGNLAAALVELLLNKSLLVNLGQMARLRAVVNFSWQSQLQDYINMYNSILKD